LDQLNVSEGLIDQVKKLKYITVDEYQDTNSIQEAILEKMKLINPNLNICVVGDDDQTLYEWRGSNLSVFRDFPAKFDTAKTIKLTTNYRSSEGIVRVGESVARSISPGNRINKDFFCSDTYIYEYGDIIAETDFENIEAENKFIVEAILKLKGSKLTHKDGSETSIEYSDMAILVDSTKNLRKFNQQLLELLESHGIDYIIDGTKQLFDTSEIRQITDIYLLFANEFCDLKINQTICFYNENLAQRLRTHPSINAIFTKYGSNISDRYELTLQQFFLDVLEVYKFSNFEEVIREKKLYNFAVFSEIINDFEKIYFLETFSYRIKEFVRFLFYDAKDMYPEGWLSPKFTETKSLKIMTIYSAKGLEFPVVFMPHLCENFMFPSQPARGKSKEGILRHCGDIIQSKLENYRNSEDSYSRLFYVAVTRSMKYLIMTKAIEYNKGGRYTYSNMPIQLKYILGSAHYASDGNVLINRPFDYVIDNTSLPEQLVFDFSTLKDIFECPRKFQFSSVFGFNTPLNVRMGYGRSLHNMLDDLHTSYLKDHIVKDYGSLCTHMHLPLAPPTGTLYSSMHTSAKAIIEEYTKINRPLFDSVKYIEAPIDYKLNDLVFINGRVDLIVNSESGDIKIIDFKSDSGTLSPSLRKKQLLIYALGYHKLTGQYPTSTISYDLRTNQPHESNVRESDLQAVENQINDAYHMIKSNDYPKCNNSIFCNECNFKDICVKIE
jgi:DNA helicase-2/ATP-dependent DNA helicase PcrA